MSYFSRFAADVAGRVAVVVILVTCCFYDPGLFCLAITTYADFCAGFCASCLFLNFPIIECMEADFGDFFVLHLTASTTGKPLIAC